MFAFKVSPKGYVYVRLDKLTNMSVSSDVFLLTLVPLSSFVGLAVLAHGCFRKLQRWVQGCLMQLAETKFIY
jgi:hypothetical protein